MGSAVHADRLRGALWGMFVGDALALPPVMVTALRKNDPAEVDDTLLAHLRLTHRSVKLNRYALALGGRLSRLLQDPDPRVKSLVCATAPSLGRCLRRQALARTAAAIRSRAS